MAAPRFSNSTMVKRSSAICIGALSLMTLQATSPLNVPLSSPFHSIGLIAATAQTASQSVRYTPPKRGGFKRSDGTGSRAEAARVCGKVATVPLTLLAPSDHIGQTISARPTFFWYLADKQTVTFKLVEPGVRKPLLTKTVRVEKPGIVPLELPKDAPELALNKDYRWSIAVVCNTDENSEEGFELSFIRRVAQTPELSRQLATAKSDQSRAQIYASQGLWYDALATLSQASAADPKNRSVHNSLVSLLDQIGLTKVVDQERKH
jgi:hypothetical protein